MKSTRLSIAGTVALAALLGTGSAGAQPTFTILPENTLPTGINDGGATAGVVANKIAFLRTPDGVITTFSATGDAVETAGTGINANNSVTGWYQDARSHFHGFIRDAGGAIMTFDAPGDATFPASINALGSVTGNYSRNGGPRRGFLRTPDGAITTFQAPRAVETLPFAINDSGVIVGYTNRFGVSRGFVRAADGTIATFNVPGNNLETVAYCINNDGVIAGTYSDASGQDHGFIRSAGGTFTTFDARGDDTVANSINSGGTVAGGYVGGKHRRQLGFVRQPDGHIQIISAPDSSGGTVAGSINAGGVVAGYFAVRPKHPAYYGFIWTPN